MIKVVFFDIDETLILHRASSDAALKQMFKDNASPVEYVHYYHKAIKLNPKIKKYLKKYSNLPLGIISNGYGRYQEMKLKAAGINELFFLDLRFYSVNLNTNKLKPKIWEMAQKAAGVEPGEILMIGDETADLTRPYSFGWNYIRL